MGYYKLYRRKPDGKAVHGTLYYCQPAGLDKVLLVRAASTLENADCLIPALIYKVAVTMSPRFKKLLPILYNAPSRTGIRIHGGVKPEHSRGCILLNRRDEYKAVVERLLYEQKQCEDIRLEIIDYRPGDPETPKNVVPINYKSYESITTQEAPHGNRAA